MQNAPPVAFPVGRFVLGRAVWFGAVSLSALGLLGWQVWGNVAQEWASLAWLFWCVCVCTSAGWAPRQSLLGGRLFWSGEAWFWQADDADGHTELHSVSLSVGLDSGSGLLLWVRLLKDDGPIAQKLGPLKYVWLQASTMPSKWHGFRCAVYSRPMTIPLSEMSQHDRV